MIRGGMKQSKSDATRQRIRKVATGEFANRGFAGARIETIMRRSKVSRTLIYHYFKSKEQLFQTVLEADCEKTRFDRVDWPVEGDVEDIVLACLAPPPDRNAIFASARHPIAAASLAVSRPASGPTDGGGS